MKEKNIFDEKIQVNIISEANNTDHWTKKRKRKLDQQLLVRSALFDRLFGIPDYLPCRIVLTRLYPRLLDDDNLVYAFKAIRDEIASFLVIEENKAGVLIKPKGFYDSNPHMHWEYKQEKSNFKGIQIKIYKL